MDRMENVEKVELYAAAVEVRRWVWVSFRNAGGKKRKMQKVDRVV